MAAETVDLPCSFRRSLKPNRPRSFLETYRSVVCFEINAVSFLTRRTRVDVGRRRQKKHSLLKFRFSALKGCPRTTLESQWHRNYRTAVVCGRCRLSRENDTKNSSTVLRPLHEICLSSVSSLFLRLCRQPHFRFALSHITSNVYV